MTWKITGKSFLIINFVIASFNESLSMSKNRLTQSFFTRDVLQVAPELIGKILVRQFDDGSIKKYRINEIEIYRGEEDLGCHASKGRTSRTEVMYHLGGKIYVYLIYGMYWLLNFVTGPDDHPQAILIRGMDHFNGPGKVGRELKLDKSFYGESLITSNRIWLESDNYTARYEELPRVGIDYAGEHWSTIRWRLKENHLKNL